MKYFTFKCNDNHEMELLDKCMKKLRNFGIEFVASYMYNELGESIIKISARAS